MIVVCGCGTACGCWVCGCVGGVGVGVLVGGVDGLGQRDWIGKKGRRKIIRNSTLKVCSRVLNSRNMMSVARTSLFLGQLYATFGYGCIFMTAF